MLKVYERNDYSRNSPIAGIDESKLFNFLLNKEINSEYRLSCDIAINDESAFAMCVNNLICFENQLFRIYETKKSNNGQEICSVSAKHIFYDTEKAFNQSFGEEYEYVGANSYSVFEDIFADTDFNVLTENELVELGFTPCSVNIDFFPQSKKSTYDLLKYLLECTGSGEFYFDNLDVGFVEKIGENRNLQISIDTNAPSITRTENITNMITRLYAYGKDNITLKSEIGDEFLDSANINTYGIKAGYMDFSKAAYNTEMLLRVAEWQFSSENDNRIDIPSVTIEASVIDLSKINPNIPKMQLGDVVKVYDIATKTNDTLRIIKLVEYPNNPLSNTVTVGQVAKNFIYYLNQIKSALDKSNKANSENVKKEDLKEEIDIEVLDSNIIENSSVFAEDIFIERLETNVKTYKCTPNVKKENGMYVWDSRTNVASYSATNTASVRPLIRINGIVLEFIEQHLIVASDYTDMSENEVENLIRNGQQYYYTSIIGPNAFKFLTTIPPEEKYPKLLQNERDMFKAKIRKVSAEYIKATFQFELSSGTYNPKLIIGTGDANGNGKLIYEKIADEARIYMTSRTDSRMRGVAIKDDGVYQLRGGDIQKIPMFYHSDTEPTEAFGEEGDICFIDLE